MCVIAMFNDEAIRASRSTCDCCGREVTPANDARYLLTTWNVDDTDYFQCRARHILPHYENGRRVCDGTKELAQYLEGQPLARDCRVRFSLEQEPHVRRAYATIQRHFARETARFQWRTAQAAAAAFN